MVWSIIRCILSLILWFICIIHNLTPDRSSRWSRRTYRRLSISIVDEMQQYSNWSGAHLFLQLIRHGPIGNILCLTWKRHVSWKMKTFLFCSGVFAWVIKDGKGESPKLPSSHHLSDAIYQTTFTVTTRQPSKCSLHEGVSITLYLKYFPVQPQIQACRVSEYIEKMADDQSVKYLESKLGKQMRIHTTDSRMFIGEFKCTDNVNLPCEPWQTVNCNTCQECNIILSHSYEYRQPTFKAVQHAQVGSSTPVLKMDMTSRCLGLIVVPGQHITKIEIEEPVGSKGITWRGWPVILYN